MPRLLFFILLLINFKGHSQSSQAGVLFQPSLTYFSSQSDPGGQNIRQLNKPVITWQAGAMVLKRMSEGVKFSAGLVYVQRGIRSQFNTGNISAFNFSSSGYDVRLIDRYLEVPLLLHFRLSKKRAFNWFATFGIKPAVYLNSVSKVIGRQDKYDSYYYSAHRRLNFFASLGLGAEIPLSSRTSVLIWPVLEHAILSDLYASPSRIYPYSAGINLCLLYSWAN